MVRACSRISSPQVPFLGQFGGQELGNRVFQRAGVGGDSHVRQGGSGQHFPALVRGDAPQPQLVGGFALSVPSGMLPGQVCHATVEQSGICLEQVPAGAVVLLQQLREGLQFPGRGGSCWRAAPGTGMTSRCRRPGGCPRCRRRPVGRRSPRPGGPRRARRRRHGRIPGPIARGSRRRVPG